MTLAEKITWCRKRAGISQEELAEKAGVSRQAVSKWELGDATPEVGKLLLLARAFGVTTDWLLSEEAPAEEPPPRPESPPSAPGSTWVDSVPGMLGRLLRQYGWLFGVQMAVGGGLFAALGLVGRSMFRSFMSNPFGSDLSGSIWLDEAGNQIASPFTSIVASNPGATLCTFIAALGVVMFIAGVAVALSLYPKKR